MEELREKRKRTAITVEEMGRLYEACKTTPDHVLILVAVNGVAPAEMIQFTNAWNDWFPKNPSQLTAPFRVNLVRGKKTLGLRLSSLRWEIRNPERRLVATIGEIGTALGLSCPDHSSECISKGPSKEAVRKSKTDS